MKHTEGPWKINEIGEIEAGGSILGRVYTGDIYPSGDEELDANARLIAAAPELLKVLEATYLRLQILSNRNVNFAIDTDRIRATLRNAVSQATGEDAKTVQENCESSAIAKAKL